LGYVVFGGG
jgi:hypothetical protein